MTAPRAIDRATLRGAARGLSRLCALLVLSGGGYARADDHAVAWAVSDNDLWVLRGTDVDYSSGLEAHLRIPVSPVLRARRLLVGGGVGHAMFTPPDLRETRVEVLRQDRPYAGWLWATLAGDATWARVRLRVELRGGVVGPHAYAEQAQRAWHSTNRAPDPKGWGLAQVGDQLDVAARTSVGYRVLAVELAPRPPSRVAVDLTPEGSCEVGSLRAWCSAGGVARVGLLRSEASSGAPAASLPVEPPLRDAAGRAPVELFVFGGVEGRRAWRDRLVDGDVCGSSGCGPSWVTRTRWGVDWQAGAAATASGWIMSFAYIVRSPEVDSPVAAARTQRFGRLIIGKAW